MQNLKARKRIHNLRKYHYYTKNKKLKTKDGIQKLRGHSFKKTETLIFVKKLLISILKHLLNTLEVL